MQGQLVLAYLVMVLVNVIDQGLLFDVSFLGLQVDLLETGQEAALLLFHSLCVVKT